MLICFIFPGIEEAQAAARRAPAGLFYAPGLAGDMPRCLSVMRQTGRDATKLSIPRQLPLPQRWSLRSGSNTRGPLGGGIGSSNDHFQPPGFLPRIVLTLDVGHASVRSNGLVRPDVCRPDNVARRAALPTTPWSVFESPVLIQSEPIRLQTSG
jgi:hypothetical protein